MIDTAVILAGGKGTRIHALFPDRPKPLIPIQGKPILIHQLELLQRYGITTVIISLGHKAKKIQSYLEKHPVSGLIIHYEVEPAPLGTAGAIRQLRSPLPSSFLVLYGDVMINMDLNRLFHFHNAKPALATLVVHPNDHPHDSDLLEHDDTGMITQFFPKNRPQGYYKNCVNAGAYVLSKELLTHIPNNSHLDFGADIFPRLRSSGRLYAYSTPDYLKDMGTPERFEEVSTDCTSGRFEQMTSARARPAFFLDRDGTINKEVNFLSDPNDLYLLPGVAEAIHRINQSEWLAIVITNQSAVARNKLSIAELDTIHNKLDTLLGKKKAKLDGLYYCPHHPDAGFPEENPRYKIDCTCRKPKPGLIQQATQDFHIDMSRSIMIGDAPRDIECGKAMGLMTIAVQSGHPYPKEATQPDYMFESLQSGVNFVFDEFILKGKT